MTGRYAKHMHEAYNSSVKCNSLTIIEIMKEEYEICLVLFNDLSHYQHFPFYARQMKGWLALDWWQIAQGRGQLGLVADFARQLTACIGLVAGKVCQVAVKF